MKNLANILRRADISPRERILTLVKNDVQKDKNGKGILSEAEIHSLTDGWRAKTSQEAREYNKYLELSKLEVSMRIDAQMFASRSENLLLRSHVLLGRMKYTDESPEKRHDVILDKYIPQEDAINFAIKNAYLDYASLIHSITFHNLSQDVKDDLLLLDEYASHDKKYLEDEVLLYELFRDSKTLSAVNKGILIDRIYSCMYHEGFRKIKSGSEKDGFLLLHFFAELPMEEIIKKWAEYAHINLGEKDNERLLDELEKYAKERNKTMEAIVKETLSRWIDEGLFIKEYIPMFFSDDHTTWRGNTKLTHKTVFALWYEELQKAKVYMEKLVLDEGLVVEGFDGDIFDVTERVQILTGSSLYRCDADIDFVKEFKEQINTLLPLAGMYLFIEKYNKPLENLETLRCFHELSKTFSDLFEVDMTDRYSDFLKSFEQDITLINRSLALSLDELSSFLHTKTNRRYHMEINETGFIFDTNSSSEKMADDIVERYKKEVEKIGFMI